MVAATSRRRAWSAAQHRGDLSAARVMRWLRLLVIFYVALKYGLDEFLFGHERIRWLRPAARLAMFWRRLSSARGGGSEAIPIDAI